MKSTDPKTIEAIELAGGISAVAKRFKITYQAVHQWKLIPKDRLEELSKLSGIPAKALRPDLAKQTKRLATIFE
jgi:hypothetical protein